MEIRLAREGDIPGILALLGQVGAVHHQIRPDLFRSDARKYDADALRAILRQPDRPIYLAEAAGEVLGYCFCICRDYRDDPVQTDRQEWYIDDLCVEESRRGQGIAGALYRHVCGCARERGCRYITLNVWQGNTGAMGFYEKMGLRPRSVTLEQPLEEIQC